MTALELSKASLEASRERFVRARSAAYSVEAFNNANEYEKLISQIDKALDAITEEMMP